MSTDEMLSLPSVINAIREKINQRIHSCNPKLLKQSMDVLLCSDFLIRVIEKNPEWLADICDTSNLSIDYQTHYRHLQQLLIDATTVEDMMSKLRRYKNLYAAKIEYSQLCHHYSTENTLIQLSALAEGLILAASDWLYKLSCDEWGTPMNNNGETQPLIILGMGKLGGDELNFSSDVDLIFTYPESGMTSGGRRQIDNNTFFIRHGQRLIKVLDQITEDGQVYRVDMRLRPLGDGGPLAISFASMEDYYQNQGRDWERYAMIKAKVLGDQTTYYAREFYQMIKPFVYRRYIDFSVIKSLREMKLMIEKELFRRGLFNNIKLGKGGIREIEFIAQVFQLIRGGRLSHLQTRSLIHTLNIIKHEKLLSENDVDLLRSHYFFLRRSENLLQGINDSQTHTLPDNELDQVRLSYGMGFESWQEYSSNLYAQMDLTHNIFIKLIGDDEHSEAIQLEQNNPYELIWRSDSELEELIELFKSEQTFDIKTSEDALYQIKQFKDDLSKRRVGSRGKNCLDLLIPIALLEISQFKDPLMLLARISPIFMNIATRTTYLELLVEYPIALKQLCFLCSQSVMISEQLAQHPILLDELINVRNLAQIISINEYRNEIRLYLLRIEEDDEDQQIEALRQFKQQQILHIAVADVTGKLPTMKISDHLTYLAQAIVDVVVKMAWDYLTKRFGKPSHLKNDDKGMLVIAYGKLGGIELGYASDLDLIFLHDSPIDGVTDGDKQIDCQQFYARLVQRILHLFNVQTISGILYKIDLRLRPQGESGLLAISLDGFLQYQQSEAWIWEQQALVRARVIYGEATLENKFNLIRHHILSQERDDHRLKKEIREMREKMREHLSISASNQFDLKMDPGSIGDVEFISQYLVLKYAHNWLEMANWSDNIRILETAERLKLITQIDAEQLSNAYIEMRNEIHRQALQGEYGHVDETKFNIERENVIRIWRHYLMD